MPGPAPLARLQVEHDWETLAGPPLYPGAVRGFNTSCVAGGKNAWGGLYNGMIHPLSLLTISGVLWFQGEENAAENRNQCGSCSYGGGPRYACLMQALVADWREAFVTKDFPFAMVQLAAYYSSGADINAIRIAQSVATAHSPNTKHILMEIGMQADLIFGSFQAKVNSLHFMHLVSSHCNESAPS